jgi:hypothetical protein
MKRKYLLKPLTHRFISAWRARPSAPDSGVAFSRAAYSPQQEVTGESEKEERNGGVTYTLGDTPIVARFFLIFPHL